MSIFTPREKRIEALREKVESSKIVRGLYKQSLQEMSEKAEAFKQDGKEEIYQWYQLQIARQTQEYRECLQGQIDLHNKIIRLSQYPSWLVW